MNAQTQPTFAYMWEYLVGDDSIAEFARVYGAQGDWVRLFEQADSFVSTKLYHDVDEPGRFVTMDVWRSKEDCDRFRRDFAVEFAALDARCETLTIEEESLGDFEILY